MSRNFLLRVMVLAAGCGGDGAAIDAGGGDARPDSPPSACQPIPATGQFNRRAGNPRLLPAPVAGDGLLDFAIEDPDVRWDAAASEYVLYYATRRGAAFGDPAAVPVFRRATSRDRMAWTVDDAPVFTSGGEGAWDATHVAAPSVVYNPDAPADRRYLMMYAGASRAFPFASATSPEYRLGAAISADGITFTRISAAVSPHAMAGLAITGAQVYPGAVGAIVAEPELAVVDGIYHVWFASFACGGATCADVTDRGIAHATSADGLTWTVGEAPVRSLLRASANRTTGGSSPSVIYDAVHCRYEMWLANDQAGETANQPVAANNTAGVWHAESRDGLAWSLSYDRARDVVWNAAAPDPGEGLGLAVGADVADHSGGRLMVLVGYDDENVPAGFRLPDRTQAGSREGVTTLNVATRDLP